MPSQRNNGIETMDKGPNLIVASESGISIRSIMDISDALNACIGADGLILTENALGPEFY